MKPKVQSTKLLYTSFFFDLRQDMLERADGTIHSYTSILVSDAVVIIAQTPDGLWILNREYRHPTGKTLLGPPGGRLEKGEDPLIGGLRELFEETGYHSDEIVTLGACHPFPGICDQKITYLWAKNCLKKGPQNLDPFEFIETELKTDLELRQEIRAGVNVDGNLCIALWYKDHYKS
jgi:ADP-ribose pyrophosphatase